MKTTFQRRYASPGRRLFISRERSGQASGATTSPPVRWGLFCPVALSGGAAAYLTAPAEPSWALLGGAALVIVLLFWAFDAVPARAACVLALIAVLGACVGKVRAETVVAPRLHAQIGPVAVEGVVDSVEAGDRGQRLRFRVSAIEGLQKAETPKYIRVTHRQDLRVRPGRAAVCRAILSPPPAPSVPGDYHFRRQAYFQKLGAVGFTLGACAPAANAAPGAWREEVSAYLGAVRRAAALHVFAASGESAGGGVAAAMASGDRSFIAPDDAEALRAAGLAHLLAISGLHMGLAGGVVFFGVRRVWPLIEPLALRVPAPKAAAIAALTACTAYLALSGASVATQRAYVMAAVALTAILLDRPAITLRLLAIAMVIVTVLQPESVTTPGFHMSFAATAALIALYEAWPRRSGYKSALRRAAGWTSSLCATSTTASLATAPFAVFHFERAATMSIPANLAAMPIVSLWTAPAAAVAVVAAPLGVSEPFFALMASSLDRVLAVAHLAAERGPPATPPIMPGASLTLFIAGVTLGAVMRGAARASALAAFAAAGWVWGTAPQPIAHVASDGSVFVKSEHGWGRWRSDMLEGRAGLTPFAVAGDVFDLECPVTPCSVPAQGGEIVLRDRSPSLRENGRENRREDGGEAAQGPIVYYSPTDAALAPAVLSIGEASARGGASLLVSAQGTRLRFGGLKETARPWS